MKRYVAVMNIPSPYRLHSLRETWKQLKERGIEFHCHFMARGHSDRPKSWLNPQIDFPHTYWPDFGFGEYHFNPTLIWELFRNQPDYLFCSDPFATFTGIALMLGCKKSKRLAWCEGNTKTPGKLGGILGWIKRKVYAASQNIIVPGQEGVGYIELHRARTSKKLPPCILHPNLVDETKYRPRMMWPDASIQSTRERMFSNFHCPSSDCKTKICLIPARLVREKGLPEFLSRIDVAWLEGWRVLILGGGYLRKEIEDHIDSKKLSGVVAIQDEVPYSEMPCYYAASDLFLLPSIHDRNPLSVIEAIHSGLPIALSVNAGNVAEAVKTGVNGWILHVEDEKMYEEELKQVFSADDERLKEMGAASLNVVSQYWKTKNAISRYLEDVL